MTNIMGTFVTADGTITMVIDGGSHSIHRTHPAYRRAYEAYKKKDGKTFIECLDGSKAFGNYVNSTVNNGKVTVVDGQVYYNGKVLHDCITERIKEMMVEGVDFEPMIKFLENILSNPSYNSQKQLYNFLSHKNLPITDDGCFLAYKTIRSDWYDKYSGTIKNSIGSVVEIDRSQVDDDPNSHCSHGLHVGALAYAGPGGWYNTSGDRVIIVKVNPRDAVAVPGDHSCQKLRVCRYTVLCEYKEPLYRASYTVSGDEDIYDNNCQQQACGQVSDEELFADGDFPTLDVDELQLGELYTFYYKDRFGNIEERFVYCESVGGDYIVGELIEGDPSFEPGADIIRRFNFDGMDQIRVLG